MKSCHCASIRIDDVATQHCHCSSTGVVGSALNAVKLQLHLSDKYSG